MTHKTIINLETKEIKQVQLTEQEIILDNQQALINKSKHEEYQIKRENKYPDLREYLDGVVKGDQAQIDKYIADCLAVKAKYPKE
jgi:hypothetical protein